MTKGVLYETDYQIISSQLINN